MSTGAPPDWTKHKRMKHTANPPLMKSICPPLPGVVYLSDLLKEVDSRRQTGHTDDDLPAPFIVAKSYSHVPHEYLAPDGFPRPDCWLHPACQYAMLGADGVSGKGGLKRQAHDLYHKRGLLGAHGPFPDVVKASGRETTRHAARAAKFTAARETNQSSGCENRLLSTYDKQVNRYDDPLLPFEDHDRTMDIIFNTYTIITHGRGQFVDRQSKKLVFTFAFEDIEAMDHGTRQEHQKDVDTMMMATKLFRRLPTPNADSSLDRVEKLSASRSASELIVDSIVPVRPATPSFALGSSPLTSLPPSPSSRTSSPLSSLPPSDSEANQEVEVEQTKSSVTTNGALIHGRMHCFGQTVGYSSDILLSPYIPIKGSSRSLYKRFLENLPDFGVHVGSRFSKFCDVGFKIARQQLNELRTPAMSSTSKFQPSGPHDFAANFAFTLENFYNKPHTDNDKGNVYCVWYPMDALSGRIVTESEGFLLIGGWFIFPEYRVVINFGGKSAVQIAWSGKSTFHHTLPSREEYGEGACGQKVRYTRLGCSSQITLSIARAAAKLGTDEQFNHRSDCHCEMRDVDEILELKDRKWRK